jgi:hypothetical protein
LTGRIRLRIAVAAIVAAAAAAAGVWLVTPPRPEIAAGLAPEPIAPFGPTARRGIVFRWAIPVDRSPVRVEVYAAAALGPPLWVGIAVPGGMLRPPAAVADRWAGAQLLWRPIAVPPGGPERPGPLAAFEVGP